MLNVSSNEIEVVNVLKRCSEKKREKVIKLPVFLLSAEKWSYLVHPWSSLNYTCKAIYKALGNGKIQCDFFSITTASSFFKRFVLHGYFTRFGYYIHLSKFTWKNIKKLL